MPAFVYKVTKWK